MLHLEDINTALQFFVAWIKNHPHFGFLFNKIANKEVSFDEVGMLYGDAHKKSPKNTDVLTVLGVMRWIKGDFKTASLYFKDAI